MDRNLPAMLRIALQAGKLPVINLGAAATLFSDFNYSFLIVWDDDAGGMTRSVSRELLPPEPFYVTG